MNSFFSSIGNALVSLFDRDATFKQLVARWILALLAFFLCVLMTAVFVQLCITAPEHMAIVMAALLSCAVFIWACVNA